MTKKLIIVSGSDRVGKSTFISRLLSTIKDKGVKRTHFGVPDPTDVSIFNRYYHNVLNFMHSDDSVNIWDRGYTCSTILEEIRMGGHSHHTEVLNLEFYLMDLDLEVIHIGILPKWSEVSKFHFKEVKQLYPDYSAWYQRDQIEIRRVEHNSYNQKLVNFYDNITAFESIRFDHMVSYDEVFGLRPLVKTNG